MTTVSGMTEHGSCRERALVAMPHKFAYVESRQAPKHPSHRLIQRKVFENGCSQYGLTHGHQMLRCYLQGKPSVRFCGEHSRPVIL